MMNEFQKPFFSHSLYISLNPGSEGRGLSGVYLVFYFALSASYSSGYVNKRDKDTKTTKKAKVWVRNASGRPTVSTQETYT